MLLLDRVAAPVALVVCLTLICTILLSQLIGPVSGESAAVLRAPRQFLKPERQDKVERAAQLARFIHLGKTLLLSEGGTHDV